MARRGVGVGGAQRISGVSNSFIFHPWRYSTNFPCNPFFNFLHFICLYHNLLAHVRNVRSYLYRPSASSLSFSLPIGMSVYVSACIMSESISVSLPHSVSVCLSECLSVCLFLCLSIPFSLILCLPLSVSLCIYKEVYLSLSLSLSLNLIPWPPFPSLSLLSLWLYK